MGDVIRFPGSEISGAGPIHNAFSATEQPSFKNPDNLLFEGDGISQEQFENAALFAIDVLEATAASPVTRDTRELREDLVETYTAAQVVALLDTATPKDWQKRPELYRALALRFHLIASQHRQ